MLKSYFSFTGRIRRLEYGISIIVYWVISYNLDLLLEGAQSNSIDSIYGILGVLLYIPTSWFMIAQSAKRCHDLGKNGWWQLIPFYIFWLIFSDGQVELNKYGYNPKSIQNDNSLDLDTFSKSEYNSVQEK